MLSKKLRVTEGTMITVINAPSGYKKKLGPTTKGVTISEELTGKKKPFIHLFVKDQHDLQQYFPKAIKALDEGGLLWISYPKGSSGIQTDLTRDKGWEILNSVELQWLSMISFDETWSAFLLKNSKAPKVQSKASEEYHDLKSKWTDAEKKKVALPAELKAAFASNKKAKEAYENLSFTCKKEYVLWIVSAKREETKLKRVESAVEMLVKGRKTPMEK